MQMSLGQEKERLRNDFLCLQGYHTGQVMPRIGGPDRTGPGDEVWSIRFCSMERYSHRYPDMRIGIFGTRLESKSWWTYESTDMGENIL